MYLITVACWFYDRASGSGNDWGIRSTAWWSVRSQCTCWWLNCPIAGHGLGAGRFVMVISKFDGGSAEKRTYLDVRRAVFHLDIVRAEGSFVDDLTFFPPAIVDFNSNCLSEFKRRAVLCVSVVIAGLSGFGRCQCIFNCFCRFCLKQFVCRWHSCTDMSAEQNLNQ